MNIFEQEIEARKQRLDIDREIRQSIKGTCLRNKVEALVLYCLSNGEQLTAGAIYTKCNVGNSHVSNACISLQRQKFIESFWDKVGGRNRYLYLITDKGHKLIESILNNQEK